MLNRVVLFTLYPVNNANQQSSLHATCILLCIMTKKNHGFSDIQQWQYIDTDFRNGWLLHVRFQEEDSLVYTEVFLVV